MHRMHTLLETLRTAALARAGFYAEGTRSELESPVSWVGL